jgi:hypothetical protein
MLVIGSIASLDFQSHSVGLPMFGVGVLMGLGAGWFGRLAEDEFKRCSLPQPHAQLDTAKGRG